MLLVAVGVFAAASITRWSNNAIAGIMGGH